MPRHSDLCETYDILLCHATATSVRLTISFYATPQRPLCKLTISSYAVRLTISSYTAPQQPLCELYDFFFMPRHCDFCETYIILLYHTTAPSVRLTISFYAAPQLRIPASCLVPATLETYDSCFMPCHCDLCETYDFPFTPCHCDLCETYNFCFTPCH